MHISKVFITIMICNNTAQSVNNELKRLCLKSKQAYIWKYKGSLNLKGDLYMRKCGILCHPISLPSKYGIGDLGKECMDFIDFLEEAGQRVWQVLPLGPTGFGDSPYQSFSTFAGNPLLISPQLLAEEGLLSEEDIANPPAFDQNKIEYGRVIEYKTGLYRKAYKKFSSQKISAVTRKYNAFCKKCAFWLDDFALYTALKKYFIEKRQGTWETKEYKAFYRSAVKSLGADGVNDYYYGGSWISFPKDIRDREPQAVEEYSQLLKDEINYYKFLQYQFFKQWSDVKKYANKKGIEIIGDIPFYVAGDSADTWANRQLFRINAKGFPIEVAGVPPDYFSEFGQLWGNPIYNWQCHKEENYAWWVQRVESILELVDIVRIDHFRAFESYWTIPFGEETAVKGRWKKGPGTEIFDAIREKLGSLNIIAEDLGDLNDEVLKLRDRLGLPGMKILQFAFGDPSNPYLPHNFTTSNCIAYTGTHDNDTTVGWYLSSDEKTKDYARRYMNVSGNNINWDLIRLTIMSSADYAIIPVQDVLGLGSDARMNTPGVKGGNWQFRFMPGQPDRVCSERLNYLCRLYNR